MFKFDKFLIYDFHGLISFKHDHSNIEFKLVSRDSVSVRNYFYCSALLNTLRQQKVSIGIFEILILKPLAQFLVNY